MATYKNLFINEASQIGAELQKIREEQKLTREQAAEKAGLTTQEIEDIEYVMDDYNISKLIIYANSLSVKIIIQA